jgi:hypothetical protein
VRRRDSRTGGGLLSGTVQCRVASVPWLWIGRVSLGNKTLLGALKL